MSALTTQKLSHKSCNNAEAAFGHTHSLRSCLWTHTHSQKLPLDTHTLSEAAFGHTHSQKLPLDTQTLSEAAFGHAHSQKLPLDTHTLFQCGSALRHSQKLPLDTHTLRSRLWTHTLSQKPPLDTHTLFQCGGALRHHCPHFADEEGETWSRSVTCLGPHSSVQALSTISKGKEDHSCFQRARRPNGDGRQ